jgi:hypothetical protein
VEPDRLDAVLAEAYDCPNGTKSDCAITDFNHLSLTQAKAVVWQELIRLSQNLPNGGVAAQGFSLPTCFPDRSEVLVGPDGDQTDLLPLGSGPMGFIGQAQRKAKWYSATNSPLCGWQASLGPGVVE